MTGTAHEKVNADHLKRNAYLYIRQSTLRQVVENTVHDPARGSTNRADDYDAYRGSFRGV